MPREKKHGKYYAIPAYQILANKDDKYMADRLGISVRTYKEKISGYYDFSATQGRILSEELGVPLSELFVI